MFVYNNDDVNIAQGMTDKLEGKRLPLDYKDSRGNQPFKIIMDQLKKGVGWTKEYYWPKPNTEKPAPKHAYVLPIPGTDYWIASGIYL
ncbi:cache domain-containing protein [Thermodesulfobacteriota bacterium]